MLFSIIYNQGGVQMTKLFLNAEKPLNCYSNFLIVIMSLLGLLITCMKIIMNEIHPGWFISAGYPAFTGPAAGSLILLIAGTVCYIAGSSIYARKKPDSSASGFREIARLFIIAGLSCHYMMIVIYFI